MKQLNENELDNFLMDAQAPAPSAGFEQRIINSAFSYPQQRKWAGMQSVLSVVRDLFAPARRWHVSGAMAVLTLLVMTNYSLPTSYDEDEDMMEIIYNIDDMEMLQS